MPVGNKKRRSTGGGDGRNDKKSLIFFSLLVRGILKILALKNKKVIGHDKIGMAIFKKIARLRMSDVLLLKLYYPEPQEKSIYKLNIVFTVLSRSTCTGTSTRYR
jgi:hypothetical protein